MVDGEVTELTVALEVAIEPDVQCTPAAPNPSLTNMGFESGLDGWTVGFTTEGIEVTGADAFTAPWEGASMARLGSSQPSNDESQPPGPNLLCQDFVVGNPVETFAFNVFTYDYTGFDEFRFDLVVTDSLYAFWAYLDSADVLPPALQEIATATSTTGSVMTDPVTGQVTVAFPFADVSDLALTFQAQCADPDATSVSVAVGLSGTPRGHSDRGWSVPGDDPCLRDHRRHAEPAHRLRGRADDLDRGRADRALRPQRPGDRRGHRRPGGGRGGGPPQGARLESAGR